MNTTLTHIDNQDKKRAYAKIWRKANSDKIKIYRQTYYAMNTEKEIAHSKAWQLANSDKKKAYDKYYHAIHPDKSKIYGKKWRKANPDKVKCASKTWHKNNRHKINAYRRDYVKKRLATDPLYKATCAIRSCLAMALKNKTYTKKSKTYQILSCSFPEFQTFIASKFTKGMTWLNHGEWHLDHLVPISSAKTTEEIIKLNHYTNFQPLWATSEIAMKYGEIDYMGNLNKSNKYE